MLLPLLPLTSLLIPTITAQQSSFQITNSRILCRGQRCAYQFNIAGTTPYFHASCSASAARDSPKEIFKSCANQRNEHDPSTSNVGRVDVRTQLGPEVMNMIEVRVYENATSQVWGATRYGTYEQLSQPYLAFVMYGARVQ